MSKRLFFITAALVLFATYVATRDTVTMNASLPRKDVREIVNRLQEWSSPKFLRQITIETQSDGTVLASVREPGDRQSVTLFTNYGGHWKKFSWFLVGPDVAGAVRYGPEVPK
jgi:hypothetical protein